MKNVFVIVPCGLAKIWDRHPELGAVPACDVYTGAPFKVNRRYAEHFAERWIILTTEVALISLTAKFLALLISRSRSRPTNLNPCICFESNLQHKVFMVLRR